MSQDSGKGTKKKKNVFKNLLTKITKRREKQDHKLDKDQAHEFSQSFEALPHVAMEEYKSQNQTELSPTYQTAIDDQSEVSRRITAQFDMSSPISNFPEHPPLITRRKKSKPERSESSKGLSGELRELANYGWYWGPLTRSEAEKLLHDKPDGSFLVRDSSDTRYLLSLSFRSYGKTLHARIEDSNGWFSFYPHVDGDSHRTLEGLINHGMSMSKDGLLCYSRQLGGEAGPASARLIKPVSRFMQVRSLLHLSRFVIRQYTSIHHIESLPLPKQLKCYLQENCY